VTQSLKERLSDGISISEHVFPYLLVAPAFLICCIVLVYPIVHSIILSFTDFSLIRPGHYNWVGLANYLELFKSLEYWIILFNCVFIISLAVFMAASIGLSLALILNMNIYLRGLFRSAIFTIWIVPIMVISLLWMIIFNADFGILNSILLQLGLIDSKIMWLGKKWPARFALIITYGWWGIPYYMTMMLAALQTIPKDIVEASIIDGAGPFQRFCKITMPYVSHILLLCCLISTVRLFQDVTAIFALTSGGPVNATTTLAMKVYIEAFRKFQMGSASAVGVTWLILLLLLANQYLKLVIKKEF
jgi:multiple sugar transport system permease protein